VALIALVTCASARGLDEDLPPLSTALTARRHDACAVDWDDPGAPWDEFDLAVLRSTWDYPARREEFLAWIDAVAQRTHLANTPEIVRFSTDKRYLARLHRHGIPITPTVFVERDGSLGDAFAGREIVVKPSVGAGSVDARRFPPDRRDEAAAHVAFLVGTGRIPMVQPYLAGVEAAGETALVYFGGRFSHAFAKGAMLVEGKALVDGLFLEEEIAPHRPTPAELALGDAVLDVLPGRRPDLLYARVDLVPGDDGRPVVLELELVEPSVYLRTSPGSAERFTRAIERRLARPVGAAPR
jgi:O-ureido-D-serine cyclo-ligase